MRPVTLTFAAALLLALGLAAPASAAQHTCADYQFQEDAQANLAQFPQLDEDGDGIACEDLPSRSGQVTTVPSTGAGVALARPAAEHPVALLLGGLAALLGGAAIRQGRRAWAPSGASPDR